MSKQVRLDEDTNKKVFEIAGKVNASLAKSGVKVSNQRVVEAATNAFYEECAKLEGEDFDKWIVSIFKGEF